MFAAGKFAGIRTFVKPLSRFTDKKSLLQIFISAVGFADNKYPGMCISFSKNDMVA
jgi:hypothetical protein